MSKCPFCERKTHYQGTYCMSCARIVWTTEFVILLVLISAVILGLLIWVIDYFATTHSY